MKWIKDDSKVKLSITDPRSLGKLLNGYRLGGALTPAKLGLALVTISKLGTSLEIVTKLLDNLIDFSAYMVYTVGVSQFS